MSLKIIVLAKQVPDTRNVGKDATSVQKIFDRYFSVENAKESTGIGLSIAKQLVEKNNGEIYAEYSRERLYIKINFR